MLPVGVLHRRGRAQTRCLCRITTGTHTIGIGDLDRAGRSYDGRAQSRWTILSVTTAIRRHTHDGGDCRGRSQSRWGARRGAVHERFHYDGAIPKGTQSRRRRSTGSSAITIYDFKSMGAVMMAISIGTAAMHRERRNRGGHDSVCRNHDETSLHGRTQPNWAPSWGRPEARCGGR